MDRFAAGAVAGARLGGAFDTVFGLPTHVLVIHAVVVGVPLSGLMSAVMVISPVWRDRLTWPLVVLLTAATGSTFVARASGEELIRRLGFSTPQIASHEQLGLNAPWAVLPFWVAVLAWLAWDRHQVAVARRVGPGADTAVRFAGPHRPSGATAVARASGGAAAIALVALVLASAALATGWVVVTGDAGSRAVWSGVVRPGSP